MPIASSGIRLAIGGLAVVSPCGCTNLRIKGMGGRADPTTKVKGMFVRPEQIADIGTAGCVSLWLAATSRM